MPRILRSGPPATAVVLDFVTMNGPLLMPTAKGSRISRITTSALAADAPSAWLLAVRYAALVSPTGTVVVEKSADLSVSARVVSVTITALRKARLRPDADDNARTYQLDAAWELAV